MDVTKAEGLATLALVKKEFYSCRLAQHWAPRWSKGWPCFKKEIIALGRWHDPMPSTLSAYRKGLNKTESTKGYSDRRGAAGGGAAERHDVGEIKGWSTRLFFGSSLSAFGSPLAFIQQVAGTRLDGARATGAM